MDELMPWQETATALVRDLTSRIEAVGLSWETLQAGFAGFVFLALAGGVIAFTRRRQDLFSGFSVGWAFALFLGATGALMIAGPLVPSETLNWVRGGQLLIGPLALLLMGGFLVRMRRLEAFEDSEAREGDLATQLRQSQHQLAELQARNAELARIRDETAQENSRLAWDYEAASRQAEAMRIREEDTGLYTRAHFLERMREEFERTTRNGGMPLPLFIGLQGLDQLEEQAREDLMAQAGRVLRENLRLPDLACRFGETELLVVPFQTDSRGAAALARRLHRYLKRALPQANGPNRVTPNLVFVLLDFEINLVRFEDYLEACEVSATDVPKQTPNRLTRLPARFAVSKWGS
ncbi:diguanylate cyclase domain-containing protein [Thiohalorhabdus sp.]|uniref:diguanylate cyclase domain-containing protein n=1 Tax=Thiohalorhabdus sp. TaxID=3094134 RepID=UPI002FC373A8